MPNMIRSDGGDGCSSYTLEWLDAHATDRIANDGCPSGDKDDQGPAGRLYQLCLLALQDFRRQQQNQRRAKSRLNALRECVGKLYLWGEPFGVGELDEALSQSDELRDSVSERLGYIRKLLLRKSAQPIPPSKAIHQPVEHIKELESIIKQGKHVVSRDRVNISQNGEGNEEEYVSGGEGLSDSGSYDTIEDIEFATTCLTELGPSLKQNLEHASKTRDKPLYSTGVPFSVSGPAATYVSLVREKFKRADHKLVERLGEANWQRHKEVREKMENPELCPDESTKSLFRPYSDFHDSGIGTSVPAQIEYPPSHTSLQSSNIEGEQVSLRVPKEPPEVSARKPFQCFLCRCIITNIRNRVDWKMHVFADLRPYICTFPECVDELARFANRAAWADHEFTEHRCDRIWNCPECLQKFASASEWERHLKEMHRRVFTGPQLHVARNTAYQAHPRPAETEECPLCRVVLRKPRRELIKHIARHMEEIALMVLPHGTDEDSDESSVSIMDRTSSDPAGWEPLDSKRETDKDDSDEDSAGTLQNSLGSENAEKLPDENVTGAHEERSYNETGKRSTNDTTNQRELYCDEMNSTRLNRDSFVAADSERALDANLAPDGQISSKGIKSRIRLRRFSSRYGFWTCGHCGEATSLTRFIHYCKNPTCFRPKDSYATEFS